jgi:hypothetical protein
VNQWYHVVLVNNGGTAKVYLNGVAGSSFSLSGLTVNSFGNDPYGEALAGRIDEAAYWNRALSSAEATELYRRGANRIKYQVRSCPDSTCSTNPAWLGPDGTNQTYFSELNNNLVQSDSGDLNSSDSVKVGLPTMNFANFSSLSVASTRYFQYRAIMESDDTGAGCNYGSGATWCSPELKTVTVTP